MKKRNYLKLNLQLFSENGAEMVNSETDEILSADVGQETEKGVEDEFQSLIDGKFKDEFHKKTQSIIDKRFKETKLLEDFKNKTDGNYSARKEELKLKKTYEEEPFADFGDSIEITDDDLKAKLKIMSDSHKVVIIVPSFNSIFSGEITFFTLNSSCFFAVPFSITDPNCTFFTSTFLSNLCGSVKIYGKVSKVISPGTSSSNVTWLSFIIFIWLTDSFSSIIGLNDV